jgi:hypothetical protein
MAETAPAAQDGRRNGLLLDVEAPRPVQARPAPGPAAMGKWLAFAVLVFLVSAAAFLFFSQAEVQDVFPAVLLLPAFQFMAGPRARQPAWFVAVCRHSRIFAGILAVFALAGLGGLGFLVCLSLQENPDSESGGKAPDDSLVNALTVAVALPACVGGKYVYSWWADRKEKAHEAEEKERRQRYIAKFPLRTLDANDMEAAAGAARGCPVCLDDFSLSDDRITLPCFHNFHKDCIGGWLDQHSLCPVCRYDITTGFDGHQYSLDHPHLVADAWQS